MRSNQEINNCLENLLIKYLSLNSRCEKERRLIMSTIVSKQMFDTVYKEVPLLVIITSFCCIVFQLMLNIIYVQK